MSHQTATQNKTQWSMRACHARVLLTYSCMLVSTHIVPSPDSRCVLLPAPLQSWVMLGLSVLPPFPPEADASDMIWGNGAEKDA